jgi:hypothetical protein
LPSRTRICMLTLAATLNLVTDAQHVSVDIYDAMKPYLSGMSQITPRLLLLEPAVMTVPTAKTVRNTIAVVHTRMYWKTNSENRLLQRPTYCGPLKLRLKFGIGNRLGDLHSQVYVSPQQFLLRISPLKIYA